MIASTEIEKAIEAGIGVLRTERNWFEQMLKASQAHSADLRRINQELRDRIAAGDLVNKNLLDEIVALKAKASKKKVKKTK